MSKLALTALVLLAGAGCSSKDEWPRAASSETLTLEWKGPAVGLVQTTHEHAAQDLTLTAGSKAPEQVHLERQFEKRTEVLEVTATFRSKVKVRYERARESQRSGSETVERDLAVAGKSYLVSNAGGFVATSADGAAISPDELELVRDDIEDELGRVPGMAKVILGRSWTRGEAVTMDPDQLVAVAADMGPGTRVLSLTVTWIGNEAGIARFDLVVDAAGDGGMKMPMKATVKIEIDRARPVEVTGTAELSGRSNGGTITGTISTRVINTYVDP